jgi:hypothetical protein
VDYRTLMGPINTTNGVYFARIQKREPQQSKVLSFIW